MGNALVITIGTREIQFSKSKTAKGGFKIEESKNKILLTHEHIDSLRINVASNTTDPGYYVCTYPREAGTQILNHWDLMAPLLEFPLFHQVLEELAIEPGLRNILLVTTDQKDLDLSNEYNNRNYNRDTLYFGRIIKKYFADYTALGVVSFNELVITERLFDIDYQYRQFGKLCQLFFNHGVVVSQVFILAQGGIDQINQALSLQMIQLFGTKVKLWQKAEGNEPTELLFPFYFINDLNKQKLLKHASDYSFQLIPALVSKGLERKDPDNASRNKQIRHLALYATKRLSRRHDCIKENIELLDQELISSALLLELQSVIVDQTMLLQDMYISAKIQYEQRSYTDLLWRLYTLAENIFKARIEEYFKIKVDDYYSPMTNRIDADTSWTELLKKMSPNPLPKLKENGVRIDNPNRRAFYWITYVIEDFEKSTNLEIYQRVYIYLERLTEPRNDLTHRTVPVKIEEILTLLDHPTYGIKGLFDDLDKILNITDFGVFDKIKNEIIRIASTQTLF